MSDISLRFRIGDVAALDSVRCQPMLNKNTKVDVKNYSLALFVGGD
jgi:hypothetical protein